MSNKDNIKNNKNPIQIYYLCNDDKCKKLIEMINVIVLNKLLKNQSYINETNDISEAVLKKKINELTSKLIVPPMTKKEYEEYTNTNVEKIAKEENDFINNMSMNGMGMGMNGMDSGMTTVEMEHVPHIPKGGNISKRKSYKQQQRHQKTKNHKKSKRIRKI
uniref:Uncharacterized protein n=1 Tax=viral metagenome TaxID=1070528 RepID=A0A6C0EGB2_9ZZZZ